MVEPLPKSTLILKVRQLNPEDPVKFNYSINDEFLLTPSGVSFTDFDSKLIKVSQNIEKDPILFGRLKPGSKSPNVSFHPLIESISEKQFEIKGYNEETGFFFCINNLTANNPTCLKVGKQPFLLSQGMLFELCGKILEIDFCYPIPTEQDNLPDVTFVDVTAKTQVAQDEAVTMIRNPKKPKPLPKRNKIPIEIKVKVGDKVEVEFGPKNDKMEYLVRVGSAEDNELVIPGLDPVQMVIKYDPSFQRWVVYSDSPKGAYLYLISSKDFQSKTIEKDKKVSCNLYNGMTIAFGGNELEVMILK